MNNAQPSGCSVIYCQHNKKYFTQSNKLYLIKSDLITASDIFK